MALDLKKKFKEYYLPKNTPEIVNIPSVNYLAVRGSGDPNTTDGDYQYAVLYKKKSETKWTTRQGYKANDEIIVRPYTNTDYDICIKVKDEDGTISKKYFTVKVTK